MSAGGSESRDLPGAFDPPWRPRGEHVVSAKGLGIAEVVTAVPFEKVEAISRFIAAAPSMASLLRRVASTDELDAVMDLRLIAEIDDLLDALSGHIGSKDGGS